MIIYSHNANRPPTQGLGEATPQGAGEPAPRIAAIEPLRNGDALQAAANTGNGEYLPGHVEQLEEQIANAPDSMAVRALIQAHIYRSSPEARQEALTYLQRAADRERYQTELDLIRGREELIALRSAKPAKRKPFKPSPVVTGAIGAVGVGALALVASKNWRWTVFGVLMGGLFGYGAGAWQRYQVEHEEEYA